MQRRPTTPGYRSHGWVGSAQLAMHFSNRQIADDASASVQEDMFKIQAEHRVRDCKIDTERIIVCISQAEFVDHNRAQERCVDFVDVYSEALLPGSPPNPPANAMGNGEWRKPNHQQRREQEKQANEKKSTFQGHLDCRGNDQAQLADDEGRPNDKETNRRQCFLISSFVWLHLQRCL